MNATLVRWHYGADATLGNLHVGNLRLATLEEPWRPDPDGPGGQRREPGKRESCVPDGQYVLRPHSSVRFPNVWALVNPGLGVWYQPEEIPTDQSWGRSAILIHVGNTTEDILGCLLVGMRHGRLDGMPAVLESRRAVDHLRAALGPGQNSLTIRPTAGTSEVAA